MIQRCTNPNHIAYTYYGGSGVMVCQQWQDSYEAFLDHIGEAPEGMWLDRIDNTKGYQPGNVRWVTPKESASNRSHTGPPTNPGSLRQIAIKAGLPYSVVYQRVKLHRWPLEQALSTPILDRGSRRPELPRS